MRSIRALTVALALSAAGCGGASSTPPPLVMPQPVVDCRGIPAGTCQEIVSDARTNAGAGVIPLRIQAVCTAPPCTLARGDVAVEIRYSNGQTSSYGMGWSGPGNVPVPPPVEVLPVEPVCQGVLEASCRDYAMEAVRGADGGLQVRSIIVRCTLPACTATNGEGQTIVTFVDGSTTTSDWAYQNGG